MIPARAQFLKSPPIRFRLTKAQAAKIENAKEAGEAVMVVGYSQRHPWPDNELVYHLRLVHRLWGSTGRDESCGCHGKTESAETEAGETTEQTGMSLQPDRVEVVIPKLIGTSFNDV